MDRRCAHVPCSQLLWYDRRADARYCDDACKQAAYRARRQPAAVEPVNASAIVGKWFTWYPPDIRELLLQGEDKAGWGKWLATAILEDGGDIVRGGPVAAGVVQLRGGPDEWCWRDHPLDKFVREASPVEP